MDDFKRLQTPLIVVLIVAIILQVIFSLIESHLAFKRKEAERTRALEARLATDKDGEFSEAYQDYYCSDVDMIRYIQKKQLKEARIELFGSDQKIYDGEQHLFYDHSFGSVEIRALQGTKPVASLVYYRIWKNGNDNIRAHLDTFGKICNSSKIRAECSPVHVQTAVSTGKLCIDHCYVDNSHLNYVNSELAAATMEKYSKGNKNYLSTRFPFTFIRHPIHRFVSGYTEVEYRLSKSTDKDFYKLPLYQTVGTAERFKEFIRMILKADGSKRYLHDKSVEIPHVAPQIGTFLTALNIEGKRLRKFRLESFHDEFRRLANESGFIGLVDVLSPTDLAIHPSSKDPLKTTKAAYTFLNHSLKLTTEEVAATQEAIATARATSDGSSSTDGVIVTRNATLLKRQISSSYLKALCRIYLADFMCTGYDLPPLCAPLAEEYRTAVDEYVADHSKRMAVEDKSWKGLIYSALVYLYAEIECVFESNPQCVTDIIYGKDSGIDID